jgi:predicted nucleotidyltransferase
LAEGEKEYLLLHWKLLVETREALRTEPRVRVAVLAGSTARGDDRPGSDVDLVVDLEDEKPLDRMRLGMRVADKLGRSVDIASLPRLRDEPLSLLQLLDEGRVLVDREGRWPEMRSERPVVYKRAKRAYERQQRLAAVALGEPEAR